MVFSNLVDGILSNKNGFKKLMKMAFKRPHPLSPSPQMWRGGTRGRGKKI
jgi:hypothetical protein